MSFSFSKTWTSASKDERDKWHHVQGSLQRMFSERSPEALVPRTWQEWLFHRQASLETHARVVKRRVEASRQAGRHKAPLPPFNGKRFNDNLSAVTCRETIWCPESPTREDRWGATQWPGKKEMAYEGDERVYSENGDFRRFLPLVRDWKRGKETSTAAFEKVPTVPAFEFDVVQKKPTVEDIMTPTAEVFFEDETRFLVKDLLVALDEDDIL